MSRWRDEAKRRIADVLARLPADADEKAKRAACRDAYPWGPRENHPYKIWCDETNVQLGKKPPADMRASLASKQRANMSPRNQRLLALYEQAMKAKDGK